MWLRLFNGVEWLTIPCRCSTPTVTFSTAALISHLLTFENTYLTENRLSIETIAQHIRYQRMDKLPSNFKSAPSNRYNFVSLLISVYMLASLPVPTPAL